MRRCHSCRRITPPGPNCAHCLAVLTESATVATGRTYALRALGIVTVIAIGIVTLTNAMLGLYPLVGKSLADSYDTVDAAYTAYSAIALVTVVAWVPAAVLFIVWLWRARKNMDALTFPRPTLGAGWAIGGWFIPFANLVIPCRMVYQVASNTIGRSWVGLTVAAWWGTALIDNMIGRLNGDAPRSPDLGDHVAWFARESAFGVASTVLLAIAGACLGVIVLTVSRVQEAAIDDAKRQAASAALNALAGEGRG